MAGRPADPVSPFRMRPHKANGYLYAATVNTEYGEPPECKRIRKYTHWGTLSGDMVFTPNLHFVMASREKRDSFVFPKDWDISSVKKLNSSVPIPDKPSEGKEDHPECKSDIDSCKTNVQRAEPIVTPSEEADYGEETKQSPLQVKQLPYLNQLYGSIWFLMQIAEIKHVIEDLMVTFEYKKEVVDDILTMSIFPYLTRKNFDRLAREQRISHYPSEKVLTSSYITTFTQHITEQNRMDFCRLRMERQPDNSYLACDSTTRSAWGHCIAEIHYGRNKDNKEMDCTLEVVVYSLTTHEPLYYRMFPGNEPDARTLRTINADLRELGVESYVTIFDRGYESADNFDDLFRSNIPFIACSKVAQEPVLDCIYKIEYDQFGLPTNMKYSEEYQLYYAQFMIANREYTDENGGITVIEKENLRCNLFLDPTKRPQCIIAAQKFIREEYESLCRKRDSNELLDNIGKLKCRPRYHSVTVEKNGDGKIEKISISRNEKAIKKEMSICGFFSSVSYKASGDALQMLKAYKTRDEQEKYFEQMKDQMDFHTQDASSQDGRAGREFILFVGLILSSAVRNTWSRNVVLRENFRTSLSILDEMQDIRWVRFADGREHMTEFCGLQVLICEQFGLTAPAECLPSQERKAAERKQNPKKRGRKPKGTPVPNKLEVSLC